MLGKESMKDEDLIKNIEMVYAGIVNVLPTKRENVRSAMIKLTMSKPIKVEIK
jgi:ribosomal protein L1